MIEFLELHRQQLTQWSPKYGPDPTYCEPHEIPPNYARLL